MAVRGGKQEGAKLNTSVLSRLNKVERELKQAKECIRRKDEEILALREKLEQRGGAAALGRKENVGAAGGSSDSQMTQHVSEMRGEIAEMKAFLNDYGMVWIGGTQRSNGTSKASASSQPPSNAPRKTKEVTLAKENMSIIDKNVRELNAMIGEEEMKKQRKSGRETLTIYKDGLSFNKQPFRGFEDKSAQIVIRDLVDGYFPQELKHQYPEGVKISLVNKVDQTYEQSVKAMQQNQRPPKQTRQNLPSNIRQLGSLQGKDDGDAAEPSTESFLDKVPKTVIQNGKIIQMRNDIGAMIHVEDKPVEKTAIHSLFTQKLNMADLGDLEDEENFGSEDETEEESDEGEDVDKTVIQIKREDGMQTYVLKLPYWATIQDVKNALDTHRQQGKEKSGQYVLRSAFPPQIYNDLQQTLEEAGLVPNATLFMKPT